MITQSQDGVDLKAIAELVAHCRDSARTLRLDGLTYYLDMAFVAACSDPDRRRDEVDIAKLRRLFDIPGPDAEEPWLLDLKTIRTATEGCRNWAQDLERSTLAHLLEMALFAARRASTDRD